MNTALLFFAILLATELIRRRLTLPFRWHGSTMLLAIALLCTTLYSLHFVRVQSRRDAAINQRQEETQSQLDRAASFLKEGLSVHPHDGIRFLDREGRALDAFKFFTHGPSGTARTPIGITTSGMGYSTALYVDMSAAVTEEPYKRDKTGSQAWHVLFSITGDLLERDGGWKVRFVRTARSRRDVATAIVAHDCGAVVSLICTLTPDRESVFEVLAYHVVRSAPANLSLSAGAFNTW